MVPAAGIGLLTIVSTAGTIAVLVLVDHHALLLMALCPRLLHLTVADGEVPVGTFFVVAVARLVIADPRYFLLGRQFGTRLEDRIRRRSPRAGAALEGARAVVARAGLLAVVVRPVGSVLAAAGACRLRPLPTALADLAGTVAHVFLVYQGGRLLLPLTAGVSLPRPAGRVGRHRPRRGPGDGARASPERCRAFPGRSRRREPGETFGGDAPGTPHITGGSR